MKSDRGGADVNREVRWNGTDAEWQAWWHLGFYKLTIFEAEHCEIIGNKFENPELLEREKESICPYCGKPKQGSGNVICSCEIKHSLEAA